MDFGPNRPPGEWVQWPGEMGWWEVAGIPHHIEDVVAFVGAAARLPKSSGAYGLHLERDPMNRHDKNAIKVFGILGPHEAPERRFHLGFVPHEIAAEVSKMPATMPIAAELRRASIGDSTIYMTGVGLMAGVKVRRAMRLEATPEKAPSKIDLGPEEAAVLEALVARLEREDALDKVEAGERAKGTSKAIIQRMLKTGETYGQASGWLPHLNKPHEEVKAYMRSIDNDLGAQVGILEKAFDAHFERGEIVPPYYARRVGVILRKGKRPA